ncbi:MAG: hypothetical protein R3B70_00430 [Polyangiaceae bacterium]
MNMRFRPALLALSLLAVAACDQTLAPPKGADSAPVASAGEAPSTDTAAASAESAPSGSGTASVEEPAAPDTSFAEMVNRLSEPDQHFFSDNYISNETSYLHVTGGLAKHAAQGGAYIGVGPEQNFSYIAMLKPKMAFIVDIRRENMVLHLLYKAAFQRASSRSHFLSLLIGRGYEAESEPGSGASIEEVVAHAEKVGADEKRFAAIHEELAKMIEEDFHFALDANDKKSLEVAHRAFFKGGLDLRFELEKKNGRLYPKLREILGATDLEGHKSGFLASEEGFRVVQAMEKEHRIVPVVGDFAGDRAMPGVAATLREKGLNVSAFYVSNVEQYLFENNVWGKWAKNVAALPVDEKSVFIRAYLDQGKKHPREKKGHRTASVLQRMSDFNARQAKKPYTSWFEVATDQMLD